MNTTTIPTEQLTTSETNDKMREWDTTVTSILYFLFSPKIQQKLMNNNDNNTEWNEMFGDAVCFPIIKMRRWLPSSDVNDLLSLQHHGTAFNLLLCIQLRL